MSSAFNPGLYKKAVAGAAVITGAVGIAWWTHTSPSGINNSAPVVSISAPSDTATVSGASVTVSASCSDTVGCVGVQFKLDGSNLGSEDTSSPFSISWDSTGASNGAHTISAVARNAAGHSTPSASISVTVSNSAAPPLDVYIAQTAAGSGDGSTCANAKATSFFNTAGNWGAGHAIAPGKFVGLCGQITNFLQAQASGTAGNPVTLVFQDGAKLLPGGTNGTLCPSNVGCLDLASVNYITVDGGTNGVIANEDGSGNPINGTGLAHAASTTGIDALSCGHCIIKNLTFKDLYIRSSGSDVTLGGAFGAGGANAILFSGDSDTITNNTCTDAGGCYIGSSSASNETVTHNSCSRSDHCIVVGGPASPATAGIVVVAYNTQGPEVNWDDTIAGDQSFGGKYHHNLLHCFSGSAGGHFDKLLVYDNSGNADPGIHATSWIFVEGGPVNTGNTPCADATSLVYVFNNKFTDVTNGPFQDIALGSGLDFVANNSINDVALTSGHGLGIIDGGTYVNNVVGGTQYLIEGPYLQGGQSNGGTAVEVDHNSYYHCTSALCFSYGTFHGSGTANFATYQAGGYEPHSVASVGSSSATTAGVGENLTATCNSSADLAPLCSDINGLARPTVGAWVAGAVG